MTRDPLTRAVRLSTLSLIAIVLLTVSAQAQTFTVSAAPGSLTIYPGQQGVPIAISTTSSGYSGPIVVTLTGLPSGISVAPLTLNAGASGSMLLNASVSAGQEGFPPSALPGPVSWTANVAVVGAAGSMQVSSQLSLTISLSNPAFAPSPSAINLPIVKIDTSGVPIETKTDEIPGTITITSANGQTTYLPNASDTDNTATFKVHGNSTAVMPKLPYHVKLNTSLDLLHTMGLSCPYVTDGKAKPTCDKSKSFILLANYDDKTFLRDWAASSLANAIPIGNGYLNSPADSPSPSGTSALMPWAPHSLFVELYLNGVYEGNYQLIEEIKVDSHRVNITEMTDTDTTLPALSGGYLLEISQEAGDFDFTTPHGVSIGFDDPDFSPPVPEQVNYITNYVDGAEAALFSSNFTDPAQGWRAYFDEASAINFYIVNDLMGNSDGGEFRGSDYFYKDLNNPLIYMGPIWDFDISGGNVNDTAIENPTTPWMQTQAPWYAQWFKDPGFKADVTTQWNTLKNNGVFAAWLASIPQEAATLQQSQANNFGRWPMQGIEVWPNAEAAGSYQGEIQFFLNWLNLRFAYLDSVLNAKTATTVALTASSGTLRNNAPATLTAQISGATNPSGSVSFFVNNVLAVTTPLSQSSASFTTSSLPPGNAVVQAVYSGDAHNALSASDAQTLTVLPALIPTVTSLAGPSTAPNQTTYTTFTISVVGNTNSVAPTGFAYLNVNGAVADSRPLKSDGTSSISVILPVGSQSVQVAYPGDANYAASTSNVVAINVAAAPDFTLTTETTTASARGKNATPVTLTVTPQYGFNQSVAFSCSTPTGTLTCTFSPATVTTSGSPATTSVSFAYSKANAQNLSLALPRYSRFIGGLAMALLILLPGRNRRFRSYFAMAMLISGGLMLSSCGGSTTTVIPVILSGTGGGITQNTHIELTVK